MSLNSPGLGGLVWNQFIYKLQAYSGIFLTMVIVQLFAFLFGNSGMMGMGSGNVSINIHFYSADTVFMLTMVWMFISSILLTTRAYKEDDFVFVTSRLSSNLSNILFLVAASLIGAVTVLLSGFLVRTVTYLFSSENFVSAGMPAGAGELFSGMAAIFLYLLLFGGVGYLIGSIVQLHRGLIVVVPVVLVGGFIFGIDQERFFEQIRLFFFAEHSFFPFLLKTLLTTGLLFLCSILISLRKEVRP